MFRLEYLIAVTGAWALGNGILHDAFVLAQRRAYDRDLIRLLMDGHILIFSGLTLVISYSGIRDTQPWAFVFASVACVSLLVYCALIFKILPSIVTIILSLMTLIATLIGFSRIA